MEGKIMMICKICDCEKPYEKDGVCWICKDEKKSFNYEEYGKIKTDPVGGNMSTWRQKR
jgi:hypothetical protein